MVPVTFWSLMWLQYYKHVYYKSKGQGLRSSEMWHSIAGSVIPNILKESSAFIFKGEGVHKE